MLDLAVGIIIFLFVFLGLREGIVKSLGSVAIVFAALFLATGTLNFLSKEFPQFGDPKYLGAVIVFLIVWLLSYFILDLLLTLLLKKVINIIVLGPIDKVGGLLVGGFKGMLICGIILQMALFLPISPASKKQITESKLSRYSIVIYHWAYPYAKKIAPKLNNLMKINLVEEMNKAEEPKPKENEITPEKFMEKIPEYDKNEVKEVLSEQEKKIKELLKKQKLLPDIPQEK